MFVCHPFRINFDEKRRWSHHENRIQIEFLINFFASYISFPRFYCLNRRNSSFLSFSILFFSAKRLFPLLCCQQNKSSFSYIFNKIINTFNGIDTEFTQKEEKKNQSYKTIKTNQNRNNNNSNNKIVYDIRLRL